MSEHITHEQVKRLRELERQGTVLPWFETYHEKHGAALWGGDREILFRVEANISRCKQLDDGRSQWQKDNALVRESRNLLPALLDTLDEAMEALADAELEFMSDISTVGWTFEKGGKLNQVRERARALLAAWNAGKGSE